MYIGYISAYTIDRYLHRLHVKYIAFIKKALHMFIYYITLKCCA